MDAELRDTLDCITGILLNLPEEINAALKNGGVTLFPCNPKQKKKDDLFLKTKLEWHNESFCDFTKLEVDLDYHMHRYLATSLNKHLNPFNGEFVLVLQTVLKLLNKLRRVTQRELEGTVVLDDDFKIDRTRWKDDN